MPELSLHSVSRRELLTFLYKYRRRLLRAFFIPLVLSIILSFLPTPRYQAESILIVRLGSEYVYQPEVESNANGPQPAIPFDRDQIFKSEVAILSSDDLHRQVVEMIGVDRLFPDMAHPTGFAAVTASVRTAIMRTFQAIGFVEEEQLTPEQIQRKRVARGVERFDKYLDILLQKESAVISVTFEHKDDLVATQTLESLLKLYFDKHKQLYFEPRTPLVEAQLQAKREQAQAAEKAVEDFKREHHIYSFDDQRAELLRQRGEAQAQAATIISAGLDQKIAGFDDLLSRLGAQEAKLKELQDAEKIAADSLSLYSQKLDAARAYDDLQRQRADSVRVIQPPIASPEPKSWQGLIILGGFFVAIISVLAAAAYTEFSRHGFLTPEQIERALGLPVLAVVPLLKRA